jgi:hypothetical protein
MALKWRHKFVVEGASSFPTDMLRYDHCWPATGDDASLISLLQARAHGLLVDEDDLSVKRITLVRDTETKVQGPEVGRWKSFGWEVVGIETTKL